MKKIFLILLLTPPIAFASNFTPNANYEICFTPNYDCTKQIITAISQAKQQILVQAYILTSMPIAKALVLAKRRGVDIKVLLDKGQLKINHPTLSYLRNQKVWIKIDYELNAAHNKIMIIDNRISIFGSFNFTKTAQKNAENVIIIEDQILTKKFIRNWFDRESRSIAEEQLGRSLYMVKLEPQP